MNYRRRRAQRFFDRSMNELAGRMHALTEKWKSLAQVDHKFPCHPEVGEVMLLVAEALNAWEKVSLAVNLLIEENDRG